MYEEAALPLLSDYWNQHTLRDKKTPAGIEKRDKYIHFLFEKLYLLTLELQSHFFSDASWLLETE